MTSTVLLQAQRFARFPPGGSLLVPVSSRRAALAGLALFTPCRRNAEAAHAVAWAATWLLGPRALPGERHTLDPPLDRQTWNELLTAWRKDISAFDEIAVYLRPQAQRPGFGVLLLRRGASLAFIKVARAESKELAAEYDAIRRVRAFSPASFATPSALLLADLETCSYLALSPMEARRHSVVHEPPLEQITGEIAAALSGLPKPAETPQSWLPMHGDFAPWNLRKSGKQLVLYDWEKVVNAAYGATRPGRPGTAIALRDGQQLADLTIPMMRGGVISGIVTDETGAPARDVRVRAFAIARTSATGERSFVFNLNQGEPVDDRGAFRVFGLPPGEYLVAAVPTRLGAAIPETSEAEFQRVLQQGRSAGEGPVSRASSPEPARGGAAVFFPGAFNAADARPVRLGPAEEVTGINFVVRPAAMTRVNGSLTSPEGQPAAGVLVRLSTLSAVPLVGAMAPLQTSTGRDGRFTLSGVPPGRYALIAAPLSSPAAVDRTPMLWAVHEFTADGRDLDLPLQLRRGPLVTGTVRFESEGAAKPPPDFTRIRVTMPQVLAEGENAILGGAASIDAAGTFQFNGAAPGRYRFQVLVPGGTPTNPVWFVKSATINGRDLIDTPLVVADADLAGVEVTLTDRPSLLNGTLQDASGQPAPEYTLVAFPRDRALWIGRTPRIQQTRPAADGTFTFRGLLPGDYLVSAVTDIQSGEEFDPAFLELLIPSALPVVVKAGEPAVLNMRVK